MTTHNVPSPLLVEGAILAPVDVEDATKRVWAYCTHPLSGWTIYDLAAITARNEGHFEEVRTWDLLLSALMNARPSVGAVTAFTVERRTEIAARVALVPDSKDLTEFSDAELDALTELSAFGFHGARTPTITKLAALYRPHAATILDSYLATAFGVGQYGFSYGATQRAETRRRRNIHHALPGLRSTLRDRAGWMGALRDATHEIPGISQTSDVRLLDIVLWTTQDDLRESRKSEAASDKERARWVTREPGPAIPLDAVRPVAVPGT
ncbi:DUF6308 family protein [Dermacoccus barathri]|nr:DUF6308 family protein [Dermacoccus barathri]MBE7370636.1 hypothetical protein [Dermacoccus barathri]